MVIPTQIPVAITEEYWSDSRRGTQLRAFARRARLDIDAGSVDSMVPLLRVALTSSKLRGGEKELAASHAMPPRCGAFTAALLASEMRQFPHAR